MVTITMPSLNHMKFIPCPSHWKRGINMMLTTIFFVLVTLLSSSAASVIPEITNVNLDHSSPGNASINNLNIPSPRIIGGFNVKEKMPWIVMLYPSNGFPGCTGSLVNSQYILTAAHCVLQRSARANCRTRLQRRNSYMQVVIGENNYNYARQKHQVNDYWAHPQFDHSCNNWNFDFAVLKLTRPVSNGPVCLGSLRNGQIYAIGYGQTNHRIGASMSSALRAVEVLDVPLSQCTRSWGYTITGNHMCTSGFRGAPAGTCRGDSGGPLALYDKSYGFIQIGVTSYGSEDDYTACDKRRPDVYGRVSSALSFIRSKAGSIKTC